MNLLNFGLELTILDKSQFQMTANNHTPLALTGIQERPNSPKILDHGTPNTDCFLQHKDFSSFFYTVHHIRHIPPHSIMHI